MAADNNEIRYLTPIAIETKKTGVKTA